MGTFFFLNSRSQSISNFCKDPISEGIVPTSWLPPLILHQEVKISLRTRFV